MSSIGALSPLKTLAACHLLKNGLNNSGKIVSQKCSNPLVNHANLYNNLEISYPVRSGYHQFDSLRRHHLARIQRNGKMKKNPPIGKRLFVISESLLTKRGRG